MRELERSASGLLGFELSRDQLNELSPTTAEDGIGAVDTTLRSVIEAWKGTSATSRADGPDQPDVFDIVEEEEDKGQSLLESVGSFIVSKETLAVLKGIQSLLSAFGQKIC